MRKVLRQYYNVGLFPLYKKSHFVDVTNALLCSTLSPIQIPCFAASMAYIESNYHMVAKSTLWSWGMFSQLIEMFTLRMI
jgi:hypothetical protein